MPVPRPFAPRRGAALAAVLLSLTLTLALTLAWALPPAGRAAEAARPLPELSLPRPKDPAQSAYLGLAPGEGRFTPAQIKRPWLLIEIFNMYCTFCQAEAPNVNRLYELIQGGPLKDKLALVGIGVGNSPFEVGVFRKRFTIAFPLFPDGDYAVHKALDEPRTPYFLLVDLRGDRPRVALAHLGAFGEPKDFLAELTRTMEGR